MLVGALTSSAAKPDVADLLARARTIAEFARERAQQTETERRVGDDMIERMRQADLFRVMQPRLYGGFEYGFDVFAQITAAIASGCGSTGWVYALLASHQWLIACFSKAAQDEVWQDCNALAAGTYAPVARAVTADGGYRISGVGSFCSGCDNAQWQLLGGMIPQGNGAAQPGFFLLRSGDCTIDDNWHAMGLAGTGSKNIVVHDAFVPFHRTLPFAELLDATAPGMRSNPNPLTGNLSLPCYRSPSCRRCSVLRKARSPIFWQWRAYAPLAVRWQAATAAWVNLPPCNCGSPRRARASTQRT